MKETLKANLPIGARFWSGSHRIGSPSHGTWGRDMISQIGYAIQTLPRPAKWKSDSRLKDPERLWWNLNTANWSVTVKGTKNCGIFSMDREPGAKSSESLPKRQMESCNEQTCRLPAHRSRPYVHSRSSAHYRRCLWSYPTRRRNDSCAGHEDQ